MTKPGRPLEERFWAKVEIGAPDECWPWKAAKNQKGYGAFQVGTLAASKVRPAHVVAWEISNGEPFPEGKLGCHTCDNPSCCNPAHVWPGTPKQNTQDMISKGRQYFPGVPGQRNGNARFTDNDVRDIRKSIAEGTSLRALGRKYGCHHRTIKYAGLIGWRSVT